MNGKKDLRIRRTEKNLRRALYELLETEPLERITVTELCARAELSRAAFYLHYDDIFSMVESVENEILEEFERNVLQISQDSEDYAAFIRATVTFLFENTASVLPFAKLMYANAIGKNNVARCTEAVKEAAIRWLRSREDIEYFGEFLTFEMSGVIGIVRSWVLTDDDQRCSVKEITQKTLDVLLHGGTYQEKLLRQSKDMAKE